MIKKDLRKYWGLRGKKKRCKVHKMEHQPSVLNSLGCRMYVEDDLRSWRRPLQVATHSYPSLVDVRMLAVIRRDGQRVRDGQQLKEAIGEWSAVGEVYVLLLFFYIWLDKKDSGGRVCRPGAETTALPSVARRALGPASRAPTLQEAACPQTAWANPWPRTQQSWTGERTESWKSRKRQQVSIKVFFGGDTRLTNIWHNQLWGKTWKESKTVHARVLLRATVNSATQTINWKKSQ